MGAYAKVLCIQLTEIDTVIGEGDTCAEALAHAQNAYDFDSDIPVQYYREEPN